MSEDRLDIEYVPTGEVRPHPDNPRQGDVGAIHTSITHNGIYRPLIVQRSTGHILAGNHTYQAMVHHGLDRVPVVYRDVDDVQAKRIMVADNRTADLGDYDNEKLTALLGEVGDLEGTGYDEDDVGDLLKTLDEARATNLGDRLTLLDVTFGEPKHQTVTGQLWRIGPHLMYTGSLEYDHPHWAPHLPGRVFAPYPEPYLTCADLALEVDLLMVQPNLFLAGHLLDVHAAGFPDHEIGLVE